MVIVITWPSRLVGFWVFKTYKLTLEKDGRDKEISIYIIRDVDIRKLVLHEGKDIIIDKLDKLLSHEDKISPVSLRILKDFKEQYKLWENLETKI